MPPAEAITTKAVLPVFPESETRLPSESRAEVVTSIVSIVVVELGAVDGTEFEVDGAKTTGAKTTGAELTGAELTGAELTGATGGIGAAVGMTGKPMGILMDIDMLIDIEKKRRPSSSARARKRLIQKRKSRKLGQASMVAQHILSHMSVAYISVSAISLSRPD